MVTNIWGITKFFCANGHDEPQEMKIDTNYAKLLYRCPKCSNTFTINDCQRIIDRISKVIYDSEMNDEIFDLENYQYTDKGIKVKVTKYTTNEIWIEIYNKKVLEK